VVVTVNGITQNFPENYSTNDTVLTFTDPPASNSVIRVLQQAMIGTSIVPIDGSVTTSKLASGLTLSGSTTLSGNLAFSGTGTRILGDMSNGTIANRMAFQTSTANGATTIMALPNGTGLNSQLLLRSSSAAADDSFGQVVLVGGSEFRIATGAAGTGTNLPLTIVTSGSERMRVDTSGNVAIGTSTTTNRFAVVSGVSAFFSSSTAAMTLGSQAGVSAVFKNNASSVGGGYGLAVNVIGSGLSSLQSMSFDTATAYDLALQPAGGNVGIGVTPSAWRSINRALQIGTNTCIVNVDASTNSAVDFGTNFYFDSSGDIRYLINSFSGRYRQQGGNHTFSSGGSGTVGNIITETQLLSVGIGTSLALQGATPQSGTGITFPATQSASSNANTLDDYEEGTWTPVLSRASSEPTITYGAREGKYTKIGNMVTVSISIHNITVSAAGSGNNRITGLPFAMSGQTYNFGGSLGFNDAFTNTVYAAMMDSNGSTSLFFRSGTGRSQSYDNGGWSSGGYLTLTFTYFTS
jgi:hypothetical protein